MRMADVRVVANKRISKAKQAPIGSNGAYDKPMFGLRTQHLHLPHRVASSQLLSITHTHIHTHTMAFFASRSLLFQTSVVCMSGRVMKPFKNTRTRLVTRKKRAQRLAEVDAFLAKYRVYSRPRIVEPNTVPTRASTTTVFTTTNYVEVSSS
jgi:hypothetical protein